ARYFDPYDTASLVETLRQIIYSPDANALQSQLRASGAAQSARYLPERILPQWEAFLRGVKQG
ncbi:glycosyltransferase family 4 protein, partial [Acidithiobacillus ferridurans]|nr:glycosyltransferase family 4 protein [Acidithiobacillus ferridurans]